MNQQTSLTFSTPAGTAPPPPHLPPSQQLKTRIKRSTIWLNSTEVLRTWKTRQFVLKGTPRLIWQLKEEERGVQGPSGLRNQRQAEEATYPQGAQPKSQEPGARRGATLQSSYKPASGPTGTISLPLKSKPAESGDPCPAGLLTMVMARGRANPHGCSPLQQAGQQGKSLSPERSGNSGEEVYVAISSAGRFPSAVLPPRR